MTDLVLILGWICFGVLTTLSLEIVISRTEKRILTIGDTIAICLIGAVIGPLSLLRVGEDLYRRYFAEASPVSRIKKFLQRPLFR